jgi:hypothetical protein
MKSVCLLVATPAIAHALYTAMRPSPVHLDDNDNDQGGDRRMIVFSSLLDACQGVELSMSWIEASYRINLLCASPHTISDSDTIYPVSVLARHTGVVLGSGANHTMPIKWEEVWWTAAQPHLVVLEENGSSYSIRSH